MIRRLLHFLLVLTLTLNGFSAPWAMAQMNHDGHGEGAMPSSHQQSHAMHSAHASIAHADHQRHEATADGAPPAPQEPDAMHSDACCNGITCLCGCVLPPVLALIWLEVLPIEVDHARFAPIAAQLLERRDSPPFRPPASV